MSLKNTKDRYRSENGKTCIDVRLKNPLQLFDLRDPSPFRERDLDEDAVQYLIAASEDIPFKHPLKIVFYFSENSEKSQIEDKTIAAAVHNHFEYETDLLRMQLKRTRKKGQLFMFIGLTLLGVCISLSQVIRALPHFFMQPVLYEGFIIGGWVAMWRPFDSLFFDWWPLVEKMRYCKKLAVTEVVTDFSSASLGHERGKT